MNYKLAKQLKDAGFPQGMGRYFIKGIGEKEYRDFRITERQGYENLLGAGYDMLFVPSLAELIDECGKRFEGLHKENSDWGAVGFLKKKVVQCWGETHKKAMVKLYLKLNPLTSKPI